MSAAAFIVAVWQIRKTQSAAQSAAQAATEAREAVQYVTVVSDLSQIIGQLDLLKELHRNQEWKRATDRYSSLIRLLTEAGGRIPANRAGETSKIFKRAIMQLREMTKEVNRRTEEGAELSSANFNNILADFEQPLIEKLVGLEHDLAVGANTGTSQNDRV